MKAELIKKLRLKKGCKYILFFPRSSGITRQDLKNIPRSMKEFSDISFLLESTEGIKVIEKEL